jgi:hypothetical protein
LPLLYFGEAKDYDAKEFYRYAVDPHKVITQLMGDPKPDRSTRKANRARIQEATGSHRGYKAFEDL